MGMSKNRKNIEYSEGELQVPAEGDLRSFAIFTQKRDDKPYVFAGFVEAPDDNLALAFGREHYGQDQECVSMWTFPESAIISDDPSYPSSDESMDDQARTYQVFIQKRGADWPETRETISAETSSDALDAAVKAHAGQSVHAVWVIPVESITRTEPGELIWRFVAQSYRLARGYAKDAREKWEHIRKKEVVDEYQKDDLRETF